jgi:hypothetical protein
MNRVGGLDKEIPQSLIDCFLTCSSCFKTSIVDDNEQLRKLTADELLEFLMQPEHEDVLQFVRWLKAQRAAAQN